MTDSGARVNGEVVHSDGTVGGRHRMTVEPRTEGEMRFSTEAGRRLASWSAGDQPVPPDDWLGKIAAIESEARAAALREVAQKVAAFYKAMHDHFGALDYESSPHDENCTVCREWVVSGLPFAILTEATGVSE